MAQLHRHIKKPHINRRDKENRTVTPRPQNRTCKMQHPELQPLRTTLQNRPNKEKNRILQSGSNLPIRFRISTHRRRTRTHPITHNLPHRLQPSLRLLPELGNIHITTPGRATTPRKDSRNNHIPTHLREQEPQLCHTNTHTPTTYSKHYRNSA